MQMSEDGGIGLEFPGAEDPSEYEQLYDSLLCPQGSSAAAAVAEEEAEAHLLGKQIRSELSAVIRGKLM